MLIKEEDEDAASLLDVDQLAGGKSRILALFPFKKAAPAVILAFTWSYPDHYEGCMSLL